MTLAGGLGSLEMRTWTDNTGRYSCQGRLIEVLPQLRVRILKQNGKTASVPLARLSAGDVAFVRVQALAILARENQTPRLGSL